MVHTQTPRTVLIIGHVWPEPQASAAGQRMCQLLDFFLKEGDAVIYASASEPPQGMTVLDEKGIRSVSLVLNDSRADDFVKELKPDIVLFDRFMTEEQFGWRVADAAPEALRILDTEDLHSLRQVRQLCHTENRPFTWDAWRTHDTTYRELASILRCDLSLLISKFEYESLVREAAIPEALLWYLPFLPDKSVFGATSPPFEARADMVFIGTGRHLPNIDAIKWLKTEIWPLIHAELPQAKLRIYGAYLPQQVREWHAPKQGFCVEGFAPDTTAVWRGARLNLAPLRFGAGLKGKVVQGLGHGTPTVATPVAGEGIWPFGEEAYLPDTAAAFADRAINWYQDVHQWESVREKGMELYKALVYERDFENDLRSRLQALGADFSGHRSRNVLGALMRHHTMASTRYMGKWIEEKNRHR